MNDDLLIAIDHALATTHDAASAEPGSIERLALLLREEAPAAREEFRASLDTRVANGFRALPPSSVEVDPIWPWMPALLRLVRNLRLRVVLPVATVAVTIALVGFGVVAVTDQRSASDSSKQTRTDPLMAPLGPDDYEAVPMIGDAPPERSSSGGTGSSMSTVTVSATVSDPRTYLLGSGVFLAVASKDVPRVVADATKVARDLGGYPGSSSFDVKGSKATGSADLWVPTDRYADAMAQLSDLGMVERTTQKSRDVSSSRAYLVNQIAEDKAILERLKESGPYDPDDDGYVERFEQTRTAVENQVALRQQRLANLDKRVDMTLINLRVTGKHVPPTPPERWSLEWAVDKASHIIGVTVAITIVGIAALFVPVTVVAIGWLALRTFRRRRRNSVLDDDERSAGRR